MKKSLFTELKFNSNKIIIGTFADLDIYFDKLNKSKKVFFIVDENVYNLYKDEMLAKTKRTIVWIKIVSGEKNKVLQHANLIIQHLTNANFKKDDIIVGFGGGVCLDISGFIASILYRGVSYISIPTTLLSMVDASIGGKNGLDFFDIKNYLGTTYLPKYNLIDTSYLKTLPKKEKFSGIIEILKISILKSFFLYHSTLKKYNDVFIKKNIIKAIKLKLSVVKKDLHNSNVRQLLNYGHTIGHIIESSSKFTINHGLAVLYGMILENKFLYQKGHIKKNVHDKIYKQLTKLEYYNSNELINIINNLDLNYLLNDKKLSDNKINLCQIIRTGKAKLIKVSYTELAEFLRLEK